MAKYTAVQVKAAWDQNGQDFNKVQALLGISRASLYRYLAEIKAGNGNGGGAGVPAPVAPVAAVQAPAAPAPAPVQVAAVPVPVPVSSVPAAALPVPPAPAEQGGGAVLKRGAGGGFSSGAVEGPVNLAAYVPPADGEIQRYRARKQYYGQLETYYTTGESVFLFGEAGVGKTSLARYLAHKLGLPFLEVSCDALLGFQELFGQVNITDGTSHFIEGLFLKFIQQPSIIILDEVNALDPAKNFKLHQLLNSGETFVKEADRGRGKVYKVHEKCFIILAGNPPTGKYNGVNRINVALIDRPIAVLEVEEFTSAELDSIVPAHAEKAKLLRFYGEVREVCRRENFRTTFSIRSINSILASVNLGLGIRDALLNGFLNRVKLTAGNEAFNTLFKLASAIWDLSVKARV